MPECPTCNKTLPTDRGVKIHHSQVHGESIAGVDRVCEGCGEEFSVPPTRSDAKYCSNECYKNRIAVNCSYCGEELRRIEWRIENNDRHFCDRDCQAKWKSANHQGEDAPNWVEREIKECHICGEIIKQRPSYPDTERSFCSSDCYGEWLSNRTGEDNPNWQGGVYPYGPGWNESKKEAVRERDGRECQHCGRSEEEHMEIWGEKHIVHHIVPARTIDNAEDRNAVENLITLCRGKCHHTWERMAPLRPDNRVAQSH